MELTEDRTMTTITTVGQLIVELAECGSNCLVVNDRGNGSAGPRGIDIDDDCGALSDVPVAEVTKSDDPDAWLLAREALVSVVHTDAEPIRVFVGTKGNGSNGYQAVYVFG